MANRSLRSVLALPSLVIVQTVCLFALETETMRIDRGN